MKLKPLVNLLTLFLARFRLELIDAPLQILVMESNGLMRVQNIYLLEPLENQSGTVEPSNLNAGLKN
jgi:hypothetical protein